MTLPNYDQWRTQAPEDEQAERGRASAERTCDICDGDGCDDCDWTGWLHEDCED